MAAKQLWGTKSCEESKGQIEENTWSYTQFYQAPSLSTFSIKAGNKDYTLSGAIEASSDQSAKLKTSEISLKKKYS